MRRCSVNHDSGACSSTASATDSWRKGAKRHPLLQVWRNSSRGPLWGVFFKSSCWYFGSNVSGIAINCVLILDSYQYRLMFKNEISAQYRKWKYSWDLRATNPNVWSANHTTHGGGWNHFRHFSSSSSSILAVTVGSCQQVATGGKSQGGFVCFFWFWNIIIHFKVLRPLVTCERAGSKTAQKKIFYHQSMWHSRLLLFSNINCNS